MDSVEAVNFENLIGRQMLAVIPVLDPSAVQTFIIRGVEGGGIWIESQALTNLILEKVGLAYAPRTPVFFLSFSEMRFAFFPANAPSLNEGAFGV